MALLPVIGCAPEKGNTGESPVSEADTIHSAPAVLSDSVPAVQAEVLTVRGIALGGAMNSIIIEKEDGSSCEFEFSQVSRDSIDAWEEGSKVVVSYTREAGADVVQSVRVTQ